MSRSLPALFLLLLSASPAVADPAGQPKSDGVAVHVIIETIGVDGRGTRTVATDEADLVPGALGVLEKSVPLAGRDDLRRKETVRIRARITPAPVTPDGAACALRFDIEATRTLDNSQRRAKAPKPDSTAASLTLREGEERLLEAYA